MITVNSNEEISTIFVVGFPDDMQEREFQNMFIFSPGFEAATLKVPNKDQEDDGMASGANPRKQIIGFAKFRSRIEAIEARDILSGRKVDAEKGSVLKAEMAKKNLHTKRGLSNDQSMTNVFHLPPSTAVTNSRYKGNGSTGSSSAYDVFYSLGSGGGPALPSDLLSPSPNDYGYEFLTADMYPPNTPETPVFAEPTFQRSQSFSQSLEGRHDGINSLVSGGTRNPSISSANPIGFNPNTSTTSLNSLNSGISGISRASYSKSFHADIDDNPNHPLSYLSKSTPVHSAFPASIFGNDDGLSGRYNSLNSLSINTNSINPPLSSPGLPSPSLPSPGFRPPNPADQNPPCNTLYVGNLPPNTSEEELKTLFSRCVGYKRLSFRNKPNGPMCFVEFEDVACATQALNDLHGSPLSNSLKGGIRLSFSKNPLGVRSNTLPIGINNINGINGKSMDSAYNGLSLSLGSLSGSLGSINGVEMRTGIPQSPFGAPERRESFIFDPQLS